MRALLRNSRPTIGYVNRNERTEIRYDLVWERGRRKIDDIHSVIEPSTWSLRGILTQYLGH